MRKIMIGLLGLGLVLHGAVGLEAGISGKFVLKGVGDGQSVGAQRSRGKVVAVLVGINKYKEKRFRSLQYAEKDARDMKRYLVSVGVKPRDIKLLVGKQATLLNVKVALGEWLKKRAGQKDAVFVFISTHGDLRKGKYFLVMHDSDSENLKYSGLSRDFLNSELKKMKVRQQVLVLDACFSRPSVLGYQEKLAIKPRPRFLYGMAFQGEERAVFTSSDGNETSLESKSLNNGLYTHYLLEGLRGKADKNKDNCITAQEVQSYVREKVSREAQRLGKTQTPSLLLNSTAKEMLLVRMPGCRQTLPRTEANATTPTPTGSIQTSPSAQASNAKKTFSVGGVEFAMRWISAGSFRMGSAESERERDKDEGPQRTVQINKGFWMLETEVTQGQYKTLMTLNPSHFSTCGDNCPVEKVSWDDARAFADKLSEKQGLAPCSATDTAIFQCTGWRLPTEAEWEYAARAGSTDARYDEVSAVAWYTKNSEEKTHPVGQKKANAWGLYDMLGNVWEWTMDAFKNSYEGLPSQDPLHLGGNNSLARVARGGCWASKPGLVRAGVRDYPKQSSASFFVGFRLVRH